MAKFGEVAAVAAKPAYTTTFQHFMEGIEELNYPVEVFKDNYFRVINTHREHWQSLRDGWSEEKEPGVAYKPMSAHPDNVAKAAEQQSNLRSEQEYARSQASGQQMVSMADVQKMIQAAMLSRPTASLEFAEGD